MTPNERLLQAINELNPVVAPGSLWIIRDKVWNAAISGFVQKRKLHPGLAIGRMSYSTLKDTVPFLIGSSKESPYKKEFVVSDVFPPSPAMKRKNEKSKSYFSVIRPRQVEVNQTPALAVVNFIGNSDEIQRNRHKLTLDQQEKLAFEQYLKAHYINK